MLKLNASFSKKIPVAGQDFSSQSYHASVELELSDALSPEDLRRRIRETFSLVRGAVETELKAEPKNEPAGAPVRPQATAGSAASRPASPVVNPTAVKASNRQIKFIMDLAGQQEIALSELNAQVKKLYGVGTLYELTKKQASALLDSLQRRKAA